MGTVANRGLKLNMGAVTKQILTMMRSLVDLLSFRQNSQKVCLVVIDFRGLTTKVNDLKQLMM